MNTQTPITKTERFVFRLDKSLIERLDRVAEERFEGNRSYATREAIRELIERYEHKGDRAA